MTKMAPRAGKSGRVAHDGKRVKDRRMKPACAAFAALILAGSPAFAQLALPGAVAPSAAGSVEKLSESPKPKAAPGPAVVEPAGPAAILGRALLQNGANGVLQFSSRGGVLRIDRLTLVGEVISDPKQQCRIDVVTGASVEAKSLGRNEGLNRYEADIPACPFDFDVLDGAVLAPAASSVCVFKAADCQASPAGLWGPDGGALVEKSAQIEHDRAREEALMRANFRSLGEATKDATHSAELAREQANFSSDRDLTCHDFAHEAAHGFCATRLTEARAAQLQARLVLEPRAPPPRKPRKAHRKEGA
jgi:hypothetical protein